jgi:hypothetical protein
MSCRHRASGAIPTLVSVVSAVGLAVTAPAERAGAQDDPTLPIVFVHGFTGSAQQYETQAMRFASNGYPNLVTGIDRTSSTPAVIYPILDRFFNDVMAETGDDRGVRRRPLAGHVDHAGLPQQLGGAGGPGRQVRRHRRRDQRHLSGRRRVHGRGARGSTARVLGPNNV